MLYANSPVTKKVLARIVKLGMTLEIPPKGYKAYVIGIEGVNVDLTVNVDRIDEWNDVVGVLMVNSSGLVQIHGFYRASTEPGKFYTQNPLNPNGAAYVLTDTLHKDIWQVGYHKDQANCLVQVGTICVNRDKNKDGKRNDKTFCGNNWGINLHYAKGSPVTIGKWSAGCVVIPAKDSHQACMSKLRGSYNPNTNLLNKYSLILLDGSKL